MDNGSGGGSIKFLGYQSEFGLGLVYVIGLDGFADFSDLRTHGPLDRSVVSSPHNVLPESFFSTNSVWHVLALFSISAKTGGTGGQLQSYPTVRINLFDGFLLPCPVGPRHLYS